MPTGNVISIQFFQSGVIMIAQGMLIITQKSKI